MAISLPTTKYLELDLSQGWLWIWLNRPAQRNALSQDLSNELEQVVDLLQKEISVRGVILRGRGQIFCAGGDLAGFQAQSDGAEADWRPVAQTSRAGGALFRKLGELPQTVVILVEGAAIAGGLGLACVGDITIATEDAKFGLSETTLGLVAAQIAPFVVARVGLSEARRLMLTGARIDGKEAARLGLVHTVVKDSAGLDAAAAQVMAQVDRCSPAANAATKALLAKIHRLDPEALLDAAGETFARALLSEDGQEGVAAFLEKRPPRWATAAKRTDNPTNS